MSVTPRELLDNATVREELERLHKLGFRLTQMKKSKSAQAEQEKEEEFLGILSTILWKRECLENQKK